MDGVAIYCSETAETVRRNTTTLFIDGASSTRRRSRYSTTLPPLPLVCTYQRIDGGQNVAVYHAGIPIEHRNNGCLDVLEDVRVFFLNPHVHPVLVSRSQNSSATARSVRLATRKAMPIVRVTDRGKARKLSSERAIAAIYVSIYGSMGITDLLKTP